MTAAAVVFDLDGGSFDLGLDGGSFELSTAVVLTSTAVVLASTAVVLTSTALVVTSTALVVRPRRRYFKMVKKIARARVYKVFPDSQTPNCKFDTE